MSYSGMGLLGIYWRLYDLVVQQNRTGLWGIQRWLFDLCLTAGRGHEEYNGGCVTRGSQQNGTMENIVVLV